MIVSMSKIEIAGPKELLRQCLELVRELGLFHLDPGAVDVVPEDEERSIRSFALDEQTTVERLFLEELRARIDGLFALMPLVQARVSYIDPATIVDTISRAVERHTVQVREITDRRDALRKEKSDLERYRVFLGALASLLGGARETTAGLEFIGLTIREPDMVPRLSEAISRITNWKYELQTEKAADGSLVGLITVEKDVADRVKSALSDEQVPELTFPPSFRGLTFTEKVAYVTERQGAVEREIARTEDELARFTKRWAPLYRSVRAWIDDRLQLLKSAAQAYETRMCFFIHGWIPTRDIPRLRDALDKSFGPKVIVDEQELRHGDLGRVPIALRNPAYFRPFELLTSLLPLPLYESYDPTPFIGVFFPIFFGMILGDAGYGLVLLALAWWLRKRFRKQKPVRDGATILLIASCWTLLFGVLFGEFFGDLPERFFHLRPLLLERRTAIVPMLYFALAVGAGHVLLGLILGAVNAFQRHVKREGLFKVLNVVIIFCIFGILGAATGVFPMILTRPIILAILFLTPLLFFAGGVLAPLEFLKSIGNIISYVRITAIGLTSVLLAYVANEMGGLTGDIVTGVVVAGIIHVLNIILGVFSPTIHSLRLHYVEFFSKFIEHGGRKFEPLHR